MVCTGLSSYGVKKSRFAALLCLKSAGSENGKGKLQVVFALAFGRDVTLLSGLAGLLRRQFPRRALNGLEMLGTVAAFGA